MSKPRIDIAGQIFERVIAIAYIGGNYWLCRCECGKEFTCKGNDLTRGRTKSCGCYQIERVKQRFTKHGLRNTSEYISWLCMRARCGRKKAYKDVKICKRWNKPENFCQDMGQKPEPKSEYTIDRINPFGNYEPSNCRWSTRKEQAANTRKKYKEI